MKKIPQIILYGLFFFACLINVYIFISGITLGEEINRYEKLSKQFKQENIELEKKLYSIESLTYAASQAARLDYTKKATPVYLDNLGLALR